METLEIGGTPYEEDCAATGVTTDAQRYNRLECRAYIAALTKVHGEPPDGATFRVKGNAHDFGTYYEAVFKYDDADPTAREYAAKVERGLARWVDANFWAPVMYDERSQPLVVIEDLELLDRTVNPRSYPTRERMALEAQPGN